jgi:transposase
MLTVPGSVQVWLASKPVDMRRGHDGLRAIVEAEWQLDAYSGHLFVFVGKRLDRVKVLFWDHGGFVLLYKRLERGRFRLPRIPGSAVTIKLEPSQLAMLLDGIDVSRVRMPKRWKPKKAKQVDRLHKGIDSRPQI